ncbi:MAG: 2-C-methyl-D-erythritol 4-phosphate cytidylyltransferase [Nitrospirae bacterium]|nr:2-C-methyl-D-erythritol 4-phosphate cytidylyltransferase [Nitrospirota bacterium]
MKIKTVAIVPAAGIGRRFDGTVRKTFVALNGTPLLIHTLKRLQDNVAITEIIPVLKEEDIEKWSEVIEAHGLNKVKRIVPGGRERQDSVYNALKFLREESLILIHDGVRPLFSARLVERLINEINGFDGIVPVLPIKDTIKVIDAENIVVSTEDRSKLKAVQTPQVFPLRVIKEAYNKAYADGFHATDDAALVERMGGKIKVIEGSPFNIKVTTQEDLEMVQYLINEQNL